MNAMLLAIGGAMIASFWWIAAIGVAVAVVLFVGRRLQPEQRYAIAGLGLAAVPVVFGAMLDLGGGEERVAIPAAVAGTLGGSVGLGAADAGWARPAAMFWLCGVALLTLRAIGGWVYLRMLIRRAKPAEWARLGELAARLGIAAPELRESARVDSPFAAGWRHPVIVVPIAMMSGLPASQIEAIVLHELAHIRRGDYVAEWVLRALETVFFYHPAVWFLTAAMRRERERCCDDMAIVAGADRGCFAKALLHLEEARVPAMASGAVGGDLRGRVSRILGQAQAASPWPVLAALLVVGAAGFAQQQEKTPYQKWVEEDVAYIIHPEERAAFDRLGSDEERGKFIEQFWERRKAMKEEHYRRIAYANERFRAPGTSGWKTERGRTYILYGPPDEIESHPAENNEQWFYREIPGVGKQIIFTFGERRRPRK